MMSTWINRFRYGLRTHLAGQVWLPLAVWAVFAFLVYTQRDLNADQIAVSFLIAVLPLIVGILSGYALVDDPALELQFSTPLSAARMLWERAGGHLAAAMAAGVTFQLYVAAVGVDLSAYGSFGMRQLFWLAPCLAMAALGCALTLAFAQPTPAALLLSFLWLLQLFLRGWFMSRVPALHTFLFLGLFQPQHPLAAQNLLALAGWGVVLFGFSWALLKRQERYL